MYTEFVLIYVGLGVLAALMAAVIVLLAIVLHKLGDGNARSSGTRFAQRQYNYSSNNAGVAFCKNCGTNFDSSTRVCPRCGTPR